MRLFEKVHAKVSPRSAKGIHPRGQQTKTGIPSSGLSKPPRGISALLRWLTHAADFQFDKEMEIPQALHKSLTKLAAFSEALADSALGAKRRLELYLTVVRQLEVVARYLGRLEGSQSLSNFSQGVRLALDSKEELEAALVSIRALEKELKKLGFEGRI